MKKILAFVLAVVMMLLCAACGGSGEAKLSVSAEELYSKIEEKVTLPAMTNMDPEDLYNLYGVAPEDYTACLFYTSDAPEKGDMILFFEAKDAETAQRIFQVMENDLVQQRNAADNYYPEKFALLEGVEPEMDGVYVYTVASPDRDAILGVIRDALHG